MQTIIMNNTRKYEKHEYHIDDFRTAFSFEIRHIEEKLVENFIFISIEDEEGFFSQPDFDLVLYHWNDFAPGWCSPKGVQPEWELVKVK